MSSSNPSVVVRGQLPEYIAADAPRFVDFLETYYKFLSQYTRQIDKIKDSDITETTLVEFLRREFASKLPSARISDRRLVHIIRNLYKTKGTIDGYQLLFRVFFDEEVTVYEPNRYILRASDGQWSQRYIIRLNCVSGTVDTTVPIKLTITNSSGTYVVEVEQAVAINSQLTDFYFRLYTNVEFDPTLPIDIFDEWGDLVYRGLLEKIPSRITIASPGKYWKLGQVVVWPGQLQIAGDPLSTSPAIVRVTKVGPTGEMLACELYDRGYVFGENQTLIVSPFPRKPPNASWDLETIPSVVGGQTVYTYNLTLNDYVDSIREVIIGTSTGSTANQYFLQDYVLEDYVADVVIQQEVTTGSANAGADLIDPALTIEQWLESRATLIYTFDYVVRERGYYVSDRGHISNPMIRLQDNYFYQLFSYVIDSSLQVEEYRNVLSLFHPAGLKYFGDLSKIAALDVGSIAVTRELIE